MVECESKIWLAYDNNNNLIKPEQATKDKLYRCPRCGKEVKVRCLNTNKKLSHFYHVNNSIGESYCHSYWKNNLFKIGDVLEIYKEKFTITDIVIEFTINFKSGIKYKPDIILKTNNKKYKYIIVEIFVTNKKENDKFEIYKKLKNTLVLEFDVGKVKDEYTQLQETISILYDSEIQNKVNINDIRIKEIYKKLYEKHINNINYESIKEMLDKIYYHIRKDFKELTYRKINNINKIIKENEKYGIYYDIIKPLKEIIKDFKYCEKKELVYLNILFIIL